ncbi:MAG: methyltransferase domain-containing protein [Chitinispirillaceae bacterium]|nr:methyltransferase domain-containing protein [Chitinispirillaceae bacterium]
MAKTRAGRINYYNIFSCFYDAFIHLHSRGDRGTTRSFLADIAHLETIVDPAVLDVCCGTGSVLLHFAARFPGVNAVGCDFSRGMLRQARKKSRPGSCAWIEGDATQLPFVDDCFDVVTCSHALYELKGRHRTEALHEMKRVVRPVGMVLIMEHEVPKKPVVRLFFNMRMAAMGSDDAHEFVNAGKAPYTALFPKVSVSRTPSGKSKVFICEK